MAAEGRNRTAEIAVLTFASIGAPYVLLNSAGSTLFLKIWGPETLPQIYFWVGLITAALVWLFGWLSIHLNPRRVLVAALLARAAVAVALKAGASAGFAVEVAYAAAVWSRVDLLVGGLSFLTYSRRTLGREEASRAAPLMSGFEYSAMIVFGLLTPAVLPLLALTDLFTVAALALGLSAAPLMIADRDQEAGARRYRRQEMADKRKRRPFSASYRRYYSTIVLVVLGFVLCHYILDALYFSEVTRRFEAPVAMASFIAYALAAAGFVGVAMAAGAGTWLTRRFSSQSGLLGLPVALIVLALVMSATQAVMADTWVVFALIVFAKVCERGVLHGVYRPSFDTLFQPIPSEQRGQAFGILEGVIQPSASVAAAATLTVLAVAFDQTGASLAGSLVYFGSFWLLTIVIVRRSYFGALQRALSRRQHVEAIGVGAGDRRSREIIQEMMKKGDVRDVVDGARVQAALDPDGFANMAPRVIARGDGEIVGRMLTTIPEIARPEFYPPMAGRLSVEEDGELRDTLLTAAAATRHPNSPRLLAKAIADAPENPPVGALVGLGRDGGAYGAAISGQFLGRYAMTGEAELTTTLEAIAAIGPGAPPEPVAMGLRSPNRRLRKAAIRAAGKTGDPTLAPLVAARLAHPRDRRAATLALTTMGKGAFPAIAQVAGDRTASLGARSAAIRALGGLDDSDAFDQIFRHVESANLDIRAAAHLALWRAGVVAPADLEDDVFEGAWDVMRNAVEASLAAVALKELDDHLIDDSLRQRVDLAITRAVRACGLTRPRPPGGRARLGGLFGQGRDRMHAEALAETLLPRDLKPVMRCLLSDDLASEEAKLLAFVGQERREVDDWLAHIMFEARWSTDWLKALAFIRAAAREPEEAEHLIDRFRNPGPFLKDAIDTLVARRKGRTDMSLSVIEKVLVLKNADLFTLVPDEDLAEIAVNLESLYLDPDEVVIRQGDVGDELYILVAGGVRVEVNGEPKGQMPEGAVFGDLAALDPEPRAATIITTEPSHVLVLSNEHLMALFESNVEIAAGVISTLVRRLRHAEVIGSTKPAP